MKKCLLVLMLSINISVLSQNYSLNFTGSDHVNISTAFGFNTEGTKIPVSVECWVYIPTTSEKGTFINIGDAGTGYAIGVGGENPSFPGELIHHNFDYPGNTLIFINNLVGWHPTGVNIGTGWHHTAFTIDGSGNTNIYLDGKNVLSFAETPNTPTNTAYIGETQDANRILTNGKIDEIRIWNDVRTQDEIKQNMYNELIGNESNLVAYYKMSDGSGISLTDNTSGGNNGIITGATWQTSGAFSGPKQALDFDGTDDYVTIADNDALDLTSTYTIEAWIYPVTFGYLDGIVSKYHTGNSDGLTLRLATTSPYTGINFNQQETATGILTANNWYHIAAIHNGSSQTLYINGVEVSLSGATLTNSANSDPLRIGCDFFTSDARYFNGKIDEVRIWSDVRTQTEIRQNMFRNLSSNESGLVAYYRFDYIDGTTLYDNSTNSFNGILENMDGATDWVSSTAFNSWIGSESTDWNNKANWSNNLIPTDYIDNIGVYSYTGGNELSSNTYEAVIGVNNMVVSTSSTLLLPTDIGVLGNLILLSNMNIGTHNVSLGDTGFLIEDSGVALGTTGIFTASKNFGGSNLSSENLGGLGLIASTGDAAGFYTVYRGFTSASDGLTNGISRYYNFNIQYGQAVDLVFNYLDSEVPGTESNLAFFSATDNLEGGSLTWSKQNSASLSTANNNLTLNGFVPDGGLTYRFTAADGNSPLPIELTTFAINLEDDKVILTWQTATEVNNYGFEIERSVVGTSRDLSLQWEKVGFIEGHGNSNSPKEYSFTDEIIESGTYSYRLKQIDFDGKFEYSEIITVEMLRATSLPTEFALEQNYPNPFNPTTTIKYSIPNVETGHAPSLQTNVVLKVYDVLGNEVATLVNEQKSTGNYEVKFNASNLSTGMYIYRIQAGSFVQFRKMMLVK